MEALKRFFYSESDLMTCRSLSVRLDLDVFKARKLMSQLKQDESDNFHAVYSVIGIKKTNDTNYHHVFLAKEENIESVKSNLDEVTSVHIVSLQKKQLMDSNAIYQYDFQNAAFDPVPSAKKVVHCSKAVLLTNEYCQESEATSKLLALELSRPSPSKNFPKRSEVGVPAKLTASVSSSVVPKDKPNLTSKILPDGKDTKSSSPNNGQAIAKMFPQFGTLAKGTAKPKSKKASVMDNFLVKDNLKEFEADTAGVSIESAPCTGITALPGKPAKDIIKVSSGNTTNEISRQTDNILPEPMRIDDNSVGSSDSCRMDVKSDDGTEVYSKKPEIDVERSVHNVAVDSTNITGKLKTAKKRRKRARIEEDSDEDPMPVIATDGAADGESNREDKAQELENVKPHGCTDLEKPKRKKKVTKTRTYVDEDGFLVTLNATEMESCSDSDSTACVPRQPATEHQPLRDSPANVSDGGPAKLASSPKKPVQKLAPKKKSSLKSDQSKQTKLTAFFKRT